MTNNKIKPPITKSQSNKVAQKYKISSVETKKEWLPRTLCRRQKFSENNTGFSLIL